MNNFPSDPLSEILKFLDRKEAGRLANTCKYLRNEVVKHQYEVLRGVKYEWGEISSKTEERFYVTTKKKALAKANELHNNPNTIYVCVYSSLYRDCEIGTMNWSGKCIYNWER